MVIYIHQIKKNKPTGDGILPGEMDLKMRTKEEILKAIEEIENNYTPENIPEYVRGQYVMLKWMLDGEEEE